MEYEIFFYIFLGLDSLQSTLTIASLVLHKKQTEGMEMIFGNCLFLVSRLDKNKKCI